MPQQSSADDRVYESATPSPTFPNDRTDLSRKVCSLCRQRKVKCDRRLPSCGFCVKSAVECSYGSSENRKPGLRAGYVTKLNERLTGVEQQLQALKAEQRVAPIAEGSLIGYVDLDSFAPSLLQELGHIWYTQFHPWFPVLHQLSLEDILTNPEQLRNVPQQLVFKAMVAVTLPHCPSTALGQDQKQALSSTMRSQVVNQVIGCLSLASLQAILILTVLDLGAGKLSNFWNLVALAKRMSTQLGLRDLIAHHGKNYMSVSSLTPRMLALPNNLINQEERIRAFWMAEVLDSASTIGTSWNLGLSRLRPTDLLPCSDEVWNFRDCDASSAMNAQSPFPSYVALLADQAWYCHDFAQAICEDLSAENHTRWRDKCCEIDTTIQDWLDEFQQSFPRFQRSADPGNLDFNLTLGYCTANNLIIALYQRLAFWKSLDDRSDNNEVWEHAANRCMVACNNISEHLRHATDAHLECSSPLLSLYIFNAARYLFGYARARRVSVPRNVNLLLYALRTCAQRWGLARRLVKVIEQATAELAHDGVVSGLPAEFWNLQYCSIDIDEALRKWAGNVDPWDRMVGLNSMT